VQRAKDMVQQQYALCKRHGNWKSTITECINFSASPWQHVWTKTQRHVRTEKARPDQEFKKSLESVFALRQAILCCLAVVVDINNTTRMQVEKEVLGTCASRETVTARKLLRRELLWM